MMDEKQYHELADPVLEHIEDTIIAVDKEGKIDTELHQGVLTIKVEGVPREFVVNKHTPSRQIWASSPVSGGGHFAPEDVGKKWVDTTLGQDLHSFLATDLCKVSGIDIKF